MLLSLAATITLFFEDGSTQHFYKWRNEDINAGPDTQVGSVGHYQAGTVSVAVLLQIQRMSHATCDIQSSRPLVLRSLLLSFIAIALTLQR